MAEAARLEEEGYRIIKLNIGNPAPFGFDAPEEVVRDIVVNLPDAQGYCDSRGLFSARKAVMQDCQRWGLNDVGTDDIWIGNGVSELITMALQALLDNGDEILIPAPDYPLWTASATLAGGKPVHYLCDEAAAWYPDLEDIENKVSAKTKALVVINPNNPTGSVYPPEVLRGIVEVARKHDLLLFSDEIYEKIVYDEAVFVPLSTLSDEVPILSFNGLSKAYRSAGYRAGWLVFSGDRRRVGDYLEGLSILANMRLCSNVPAQYAIQTALGGRQSILDLVAPAGRLRRQRDYLYQRLTAIPGVTCVKPEGALYLFPRLDPNVYPVVDDRDFVLDLLKETHVLVVQGTGFHWPQPDHFRLVFLPREDLLETAADRIETFLHAYRP